MKGELIIVGLGPGPIGLLSEDAKRAIMAGDTVYAQTKEHPAVAALIDMGVDVIPLDDQYKNARDFDALIEAVTQTVLQSARSQKTVLAVNGHGLTGQAAVAELLRKADEYDVHTVVCAGVGLETAAIAAAKLDAAAGYAVHVGTVNAPSIHTSTINVVMDIDTKLKAGEAKIELMKQYPDESVAFFVQTDKNGIACRRIQLSELDRQDRYDAFTALVLPAYPLLDKQRFSAADLVEICRILRSPQGCPWDREQTHISIRRNMMEECCEAMAAISEGDDEHLCEELGDVLLQVALHAQMASEEGSFEFLDVTTGISRKMIRRHPHIFEQEKVDTSSQVLDVWERVKLQERNGVAKDPIEDVGQGLPALMRSQELQKILRDQMENEDIAFIKMALDTAVDEVLKSTDVQIGELHAGRALWTLCLLLTKLDVHAETALHDFCIKITDQYKDSNHV